MLLCNECTAKIRLNFPRKELLQSDGGGRNTPCSHCRRKRFCWENEMKDKKAILTAERD